MRILVVTQYFWPENFRINDLVAELVKREHHVTVLTGVPNYPSGKVDEGYSRDSSKYNEYQGSVVVRVPMLVRGKSDIQLALNYFSFALMALTVGVFKLRKQAFDVIFVFEPSPITVGLPAILLRRVKKSPLIFWVLDLWPDTLKAIGVVRSELILKVVGLLVSFIFKRCDLILGQSKSFLSHIREYSGRRRTEYFPSWAEPVFEVDLIDAGKSSSTNQNFNILFTGNIGEAQDFPAILDAVELLKFDSNIQWTIVGDGRLSEWVGNEISQRGLDGCVNLAGRYPVEKMPEFFRKANALLVSLKDEPIFSMTLPGKLQVYLTTGKPILAMLNGEGARMVTESGCGIACAAGDSKCLADSVRKLTSMSKEDLQAIGNRGRRLSSSEFDRQILISRLENWMIQLSKGKMVDGF